MLVVTARFARRQPQLQPSAPRLGRAVCGSLRSPCWFRGSETLTGRRSWLGGRIDFIQGATEEQRDPAAEGHYLNVTARRMYKHAGPVDRRPDHHARLPDRRPVAPTPAWPTGAATTACCCTSTAPCTPLLDRNPHHGIHFRVLTKCLRLSGGDHLRCRHRRRQARRRPGATLGWINIMRDELHQGRPQPRHHRRPGLRLHARRAARRLRRHSRLAHARAGQHLR